MPTLPDDAFRRRYYAHCSAITSLFGLLALAAVLWHGVPDVLRGVGVVVLALVIGGFAAALHGALLLRRYRCPQCGESIGRNVVEQEAAPRNFVIHCPRCGVDWGTGVKRLAPDWD